MRSWVTRDADAATAWMQILPAGKPRDYVVQIFAQRVLSSDPQTALGNGWEP